MKSSWLALLFLCCLLPGFALAKEPNPYEVERIQEQITSSFKDLMEIWREELYFEMYEKGQQRSKVILQKGDFAQRMVDLKWKPRLEGEKIEEIKVIYRNFARLTCTIPFIHKINQKRFLTKRFTLQLILEKGQWKYDLKTFIRAPFSGQFVSLEAPKQEPKEPEKTEVTPDPQEKAPEQPQPE